MVTASLLYGWRVGRELQEHVGQLVGMKEMLLMLHGEISYARTPLKEAFWQIASQGKEPFSSFLEQAAEGLGGKEESIGEFWRRLVAGSREVLFYWGRIGAFGACGGEFRVFGRADAA